MSSSRLVKHRRSAWLRQGGRCIYCTVPTWEGKPELELPAFTKQRRVSRRQALHLRCTAEHLTALSDGGNDARANIAAACCRCNHGRHAVKEPLEAAMYRERVRRRVATGRWWPESYRPLLSLPVGVTSAATSS